MHHYVDLQVNGYAGVDFNDDDLSIESFLHACCEMRLHGVSHFLPTVITDELGVMIRRISKLADLVDRDPTARQMVVGIHVEGPFISPLDGFVGAHPTAHVLPASVESALRLVDAGRGLVRLLTLAPECGDAMAVTRRLVERGVVVAAGHSDASVDQLSQAIDAGLALFTHLGNACPTLLPRHDNIITRVLSHSQRLKISFIADGHHVPWFALANYVRCVPDENVIIVSDAISAAGLGPGIHRLAGQEVQVDTDGAAWAAGREHYAGCATSLQRMEALLKEHLDVDAETCRRWMSENPGRLIGM